MYEGFLNQLKQYAQAIRVFTYFTLIILKIKPDTTKGNTGSTD